MSEMEGARMLSRLRESGVVARRAWKTQTSRRQGFRDCLESYNWQTKRQAEQTSHGTTQGVACQPDVGRGVDLRDIRVEVDCSLVVSIFIIHGLHDAGHVGGKNSALAVTGLPPQVRAALTATATEEQIIVDLVVRGGACTIK